MRAARLVLVILLGLTTGGVAANAVNSKDVPPDLQGWIPWVMHGEDTWDCPFNYDSAAARSCAWAEQLVLDVDDGGGRFS